MIRVLAVFATLILGTVALLAGGCSVVFTLDVLSGTFGEGTWFPWVAGLTIAALALLLIRFLWRAVARAEARQRKSP